MTGTEPVRLTRYAHGGGCACKIPPDELARMVGGLIGVTPVRDPRGELLVGLDTGDDAIEVTARVAARAVLALRNITVRDLVVARLTPGTLDVDAIPGATGALLRSLPPAAWETDTGWDRIRTMSRLQDRLVRLDDQWRPRNPLLQWGQLSSRHLLRQHRGLLRRETGREPGEPRLIGRRPATGGEEPGEEAGEEEGETS
jgi:hypothetical protein